ncbi:uncharacterized protein [Amphiura filiformis]|uniref:uncharacterized protein n=1 Tax=Amphiura filiformis TaxID=82378 RepID=UPI003B2120E2
MDDEVGYLEAKRLLERKYGNKHKIAEAYLAKMRQWPNVKGDSSGLQDLSLFLLECKNTMTSLGYTNELQSTANIRMLMMKLPYSMRDRWRRQVDYVEEERNKVVTFEDFTSFLEKQARIATNAAYGRSATEKEDSTKKEERVKNPNYQTYKARRNLATNTEAVSASVTSNSPGARPNVMSYSPGARPNVSSSSPGADKPCTYCKGKDHTLEMCNKLKEKPISDRLQYLRELGVCFGCLKKATHYSKICKYKLTCKTCKKRHPTVLHVKQEETKKSGEVANQTCGLTGAGVKSSESYPTIIPVIVYSRVSRMSVETYAYLDNGSDAVFCSERLQKELHVKGKKTKLEIETITDDIIVDSEIIQDLEVSDMNRNNIISLPKAYTQDKIPGDLADIINQDDIDAIPYMEEVKLGRLSDESQCHIGLLIGNNVPKAFEPIHVVNSQGEGPFACQTRLGWTVYGVKNKEHKRTSVIHRIKAHDTIDQQLEKLYNAEFNERIIDDKPERSVSEGQFLNRVEASIKYVDGHYQVGFRSKMMT